MVLQRKLPDSAEVELGQIQSTSVSVTAVGIKVPTGSSSSSSIGGGGGAESGLMIKYQLNIKEEFEYSPDSYGLKWIYFCRV